MANPLSSLSYTNKDFNSIYPELLDLVKQLTHKWDPSISNESDPGVILLKLDAIIGDKNNYNIDKNILEAFPETMTQEINARNNYKQLAYKMPWYQSANTKISLKWVGEELAEGIRVTIPRYTTVCDENSSIVYTLLEEIVFTPEQVVTTARAREGVIITHTINGSDVVDLIHLDSRNRLFLNDYNIAENGIFITNVGDSPLNLWQQVDNLQVKTLGNKYYEFNIDSRNNVCYLEFPEDIDSLIGSGLTIKYLLSNGESGNVAAKSLDRFYEEISVTVGNDSMPLNSDIVQLYNASESVDGANPQTLTDAYKSYRKTAGTFNTLVTLRDYINAIYTSELVSNGFVCDRTTDVQTAYKVVVEDDVNPVYTYQTKDTSLYDAARAALDKSVDKTRLSRYYIYDPEEQEFVRQTNFDMLDAALNIYGEYIEEPEDSMGAFDLKLYLLQNSGTVNTIDKYDTTFNMVKPDDVTEQEVLGYISEQKCIQHDFKEILPDVPCMFENRFPINIKIVPQVYLTEQQQSEVKINIIKALFSVVNSRAIEFGAEPDYDVIYDTICNADERIKVAILDDFSYITFATYWDNKTKEFKSIPVSSLDKVTTNTVIEIKTVDEFRNFAGKLNSGSNLSTIKRNAAYYIYTGASRDIYSLEDEAAYFVFGEDDKIVLNKGDILRYNVKKEQFEIYSQLLTNIQKQIVVKSILAGKTPLYTPKSDFKYSITQQYVEEAEVEQITTESMISPFSTSTKIEETTISLPQGDIVIPTPVLPIEETSIKSTYKLQDNESIRLLAPSFITNRSYSNYVKFELVIHGNETERRIEVTSGADIEKGTKYYLHTAGWRACIEAAREEIDALNKVLADLGNSGLSPEDTLKRDNAQAALNGRTNYLLEFAGIKNLGELPETITDDYIKTNKGTWRYDDITHLCYGYFKMDTSISSSVVRYAVSDFDPVYYAKFVAKKSLSLYRQEITYTVPSNTDYQLKVGEHITFFWREEDGDDVPYKYIKYEGIDKSKETATKKSPIIKSNFTIYAKSDPTVFGLNDSGEIPYGDDNYSTISSMYGDQDLSGTKTIDIRQMNQIVLDRDNGRYKQKNKIYFITNNKATNENGTDEYVLKLTRTNNPNGSAATYRYTLGNDEYFIYTSKDMTEFEMLSAGTLIGVDISVKSGDIIEEGIEFRNIAIDHNTLITSGISSFAEYCKSIPSDYEMFAREQQIYNLVGGDTLYLTITDRLNMYESNYKLFTQHTVEMSEEELNNYSNNIAVPYFCSWEDTVVEGFTLNYQSGSGAEISLPKLDIENDSDCKWVGRAYLNINSSKDDPQLITACDSVKEEPKQSTQCIVLGEQVYPDIYNGGDTIDTTIFTEGASICIESNIVLDKVGGTNIDLTYVSIDGERRPAELYLYKDNSESFDQELYDTLDDGTIHVAMDMNKSDKYEQSIALEEGSLYILTIENTSDNTVFNLLVNDGTVRKSINNTSTNNPQGTYYFVLDSNDKSINFEFNVLTEDDEPNGKLIIHKMIKCSANDLFKEELYNHLFPKEYGEKPEDVSKALLNLIQEYDYKNLFKYDYSVKQDELIENPLESKSFLNEHHVFNPFTISRAGLRISDSTDSTITIVNNR